MRPYLGKLSHFSAAALAACGSLRRVPSQPTLPGKAAEGGISHLAPLLSTQGHHSLFGVSLLPRNCSWQGGGRHTNGLYLDWDPFGNVHDQLHVGVVVVVCPSRDWHVVICHLDVLCKRAWGVVGARSLSQIPEPNPLSWIPFPNPPSRGGWSRETLFTPGFGCAGVKCVTPGCAEPSRARQERAAPAQPQVGNFLFGDIFRNYLH